MKFDNDPIPGRDDLEEVARDSGFVCPGESELELAREGIASLKWKNVTESLRRKLRDSTPHPQWEKLESEL